MNESDREGERGAGAGAGAGLWCVGSLVALAYDYHPRSEAELSGQCGDVFELASGEVNGWVLVRREGGRGKEGEMEEGREGKEVGYVPRNHLICIEAAKKKAEFKVAFLCSSSSCSIDHILSFPPFHFILISP